MSGKYALIIGNTEYIDPGLAELTAPGKDAEDFARVLQDKDLCAFDEVKILLNQLSSSVIEAVDEFFDQKKPDDMLVLYFSGHGVRDEMGLLYLGVKNTIRTRLRSTAIRSDYIREAMDQSRSKRQILILDCCNSGAFPQGTKAEVGGTMGMTRAFQGYGRFVLTASDATQFAWEGDKVIGQTDNSLFTHFLVKGLEGEADSDEDGKITVDELYDYAYDQISRVTPKQTPTKSASKQEGEIVLRQITRLEQIKPVSLPDELIEATEDSRPFVREGAVQQLEKLLTGRRLGLARSAREALERIEKEDDSRRVSQAATQALEAVRQAEKAEEERKAREEAERIAAQKAVEERIAQAKAEAEQKAKEEAERLLAQQKAEAERKSKEEAEKLALAKAKLEADRFAEEIRRANEQAEKERKTREAAQRLAAQKAEAARKLALEQETERTQKTGEEMKSPSVATPVVHQKTNASQSIPKQRSFLTGIMIGVIGVCSLLAIGTWGIFSWLSNVATPWPTETATEVTTLTEASTTEAPKSVPPSLVGYRGQIVFSSDRDGNDEIYVMNADGSGQTRLTNNPANDAVPAWSPDGNRIAFSSDRDHNYEIYVMNADGSGQTRLTNNSVADYSPTWSPDGNFIAFYSERDGNYEIYVMNADGSGQTRLTNNSAEDWSPAWSPDGNRIAFTSARDGNDEIYVMNADGSVQTSLTNNSGDDLRSAWSEDGNHIAFQSTRDGNYEIYVMNADGSGQTRLINNTANDVGPTWSPDGNFIAFYSNRDGNDEIYVMNADGSDQIRLTNNPAHDNNPDWLPIVK